MILSYIKRRDIGGFSTFTKLVKRWSDQKISEEKFYLFIILLLRLRIPQLRELIIVQLVRFVVVGPIHPGSSS